MRASAVDAGIPEARVQQALVEHGLVPTATDGPSGPGRAVAQRRPATTPVVVVKEGPKQNVNPLIGSPTRIVVEVVVEGEMPERDYDLVLDVIRREVGEVGQIGSVGRTFSWSVSNQSRKLQISVMPRGGKTTVRIDEQLGHLTGGIFGGMMGGIGGGVGGGVMGSIANSAPGPLVGLAAWLGVVASAYVAARFTFGRVSKGRQKKLLEIAKQLGDQIADSLASSEPTDPRKRLR